MKGRGPALLLGAAFLLAGIFACDTDEWPDRDAMTVERAPIDTLEFLPRGSRHILADSLTQVRVGGFRTGYACTRILSFGLEEIAGSPAGWTARLRLRLPPTPTCALDTGARDSVFLKRFPPADGPTVRLVDSLGTVQDSAALVRGILSFDSLILKSPALAAFNGRFFYRDTAGSLRRQLGADSLSSCESINHAEFRRKGDTTVVRYSWVTLDPASAADTCKGPVHRDSLEPIQARP